MPLHGDPRHPEKAHGGLPATCRATGVTSQKSRVDILHGHAIMRVEARHSMACGSDEQASTLITGTALPRNDSLHST
eukprot:5420007-Prymnesium_polylepis.1